MSDERDTRAGGGRAGGGRAGAGRADGSWAGGLAGRSGVTRRGFLSLGAATAASLLLAACGHSGSEDSGVSVSGSSVSAATGGEGAMSRSGGSGASGATFEQGTRTDRGFVVDNVLHDADLGDIHFSLHVPEAYDGSAPYALYVHCPGWEGLYFQGVGAHLQEDFAFVANDYVPDMIVATPQLDDWGETSARKAIALVCWLMGAYDVDPERVYLSGYSGGGETVSLVMGMHPELFARALHMSSKWDGDVDVLAAARVPVRLSVGASDEYYGSQPDRDACQRICDAYRAAGVSEDEIGRLVLLDVKPDAYFDGFSASSYREHAGGAALFSHDPAIMGWLFGTAGADAS